jgi:thiol-disulfide isomerase/thioredoxin
MKKIPALLVLALAAALSAQAAPPTTVQDQHTKSPLPIHVSHGEKIALKDYLVTGKTTIFDFYSEYCPPCRALSPLLVQLHKARNDIAVVKVDINRPGVVGIDWESPVAREFGLQSIPDLRVYKPDGTLQSEGDEARSLVEGWIGALN